MKVRTWVFALRGDKKRRAKKRGTSKTKKGK